MDLREAEQYAKSLMTEHGVGGLAFQFMNTKRMMGMCRFRTINSDTGKVKVPFMIGLSRNFVEAGITDSEIRDTILHEIAHAIAGHEAGHGPQWKAVCRRIGADPNRTATASASPEKSVKGWCKRCEKVVMAQHRMPLRVYWHRGCGSGKADALIWFKNGTKVPFEMMPKRYRDEFNHGTIKRTTKPKTLEDFFKF